MESQHMNQQTFSSFLGIAPATLSSVLAERTQPTLKLVQTITRKMPNVNLLWLLEGNGEMLSQSGDSAHTGSAGTDPAPSLFPDIDAAANGQHLNSQTTPTGSGGTAGTSSVGFNEAQQSGQYPGGGYAQMPTRARGYNGHGHNVQGLDMKNIDKQTRRITEIRVFYDDQTWESFVPKK